VYLYIEKRRIGLPIFTRDSSVKRVLAIVEASICLSVRPSHSGTISKRR